MPNRSPELPLGEEIRLLPNEDGELRAVDDDKSAGPVRVERYLAKAFGEHLAKVGKAVYADAVGAEEKHIAGAGGIELCEACEGGFRPNKT